jgi:hypothetical protein
MSPLDALPTETILEIARHLDVPPSDLSQRERYFFPKTDLLSLASTSKRMRYIFFERTWVKEHVMDFSSAKLLKTVTEVDVLRRNKVQYVSRTKDQYPK